MDEERPARDDGDERLRLQSLGALAAGVAHDFNNVLMAILGSAELALDEPDPQERQGLLWLIVERCEHAAELCTQLLHYAGQTPLVREPLAPAALLSSSDRLLDVARYGATRVEVAVDPGLPPILADEAQLRQVLVNLVVNAAQALGGREDGLIRVSARRSTAADAGPFRHGWLLDPDGDVVTLAVEDNGRGMTATEARRAFEPFFTTKAGRHGLGLSAVLGIVRSHEGAIDVVTAPEEGCRVTVALPLAPTAETVEQELVTLEEPDLAGRRILLVDDEPAVLTVTGRHLELWGAAVRTAPSGPEALALLEQEPAEVAILDTTMPGMSGIHLAEAIEARWPETLVILSSGYPRTSRAVDRAVGGRRFLQKPYGREELKRCLADAVAARD